MLVTLTAVQGAAFAMGMSEVTDELRFAAARTDIMSAATCMMTGVTPDATTGAHADTTAVNMTTTQRFANGTAAPVRQSQPLRTALTPQCTRINLSLPPCCTWQDTLTQETLPLLYVMNYMNAPINASSSAGASSTGTSATTKHVSVSSRPTGLPGQHGDTRPDVQGVTRPRRHMLPRGGTMISAPNTTSTTRYAAGSRCGEPCARGFVVDCRRSASQARCISQTGLQLRTAEMDVIASHQPEASRRWVRRVSWFDAIEAAARNLRVAPDAAPDRAPDPGSDSRLSRVGHAFVAFFGRVFFASFALLGRAIIARIVAVCIVAAAVRTSSLHADNQRTTVVVVVLGLWWACDPCFRACTGALLSHIRAILARIPPLAVATAVLHQGMTAATVVLGLWWACERYGATVRAAFTDRTGTAALGSAASDGGDDSDHQGASSSKTGLELFWDRWGGVHCATAVASLHIASLHVGRPFLLVLSRVVSGDLRICSSRCPARLWASPGALYPASHAATNSSL